MKNGKIYAMLIAAAFLIALIFSFVLLFTVREVEVSYSAYGVADEKAATAILQTFKGKNSLFLSDGEVVSSIKDFPRLKVVSVEKKYPNVLKVNVEERKEVFRLYDGENTLCMDETGFVLQISRGKLPAERDKSNRIFFRRGRKDKNFLRRTFVFGHKNGAFRFAYGRYQRNKDNGQ